MTDYRYFQEENKIKLSTSAHWKDSQRLMAEFEGSVEEYDKIKKWKADCGVTSSIHPISWTTVNVTHKIVDSQVMDTCLSVKYDPDKVIKAWSTWYLDKESDNVFNLTGNLHLESPVTSYRKSDMQCQLQILPDWKFLGAANLNLDVRTYTAKLIGDLRRLKESMVQFNLTTPLERFSFVRGRFGLSEIKRHIVAEVAIPSGPLGFEALCQLFTANYDMNVKLSLATPFEVFQKAFLVGKLNDREADFRVAYNNMLAGFQSAWHYRNITDFHYTYLLFTPLHGLEECGIVTKLIVAYTDDGRLNVDTEFSARLADVKVGVKAKAGPKPPPVTIRIKAPFDLASNSTAEKEENGDGALMEEEEEDEEDMEEPFYWHGEMEISPAVVEPITGELDIDNEGPLYKILGTLVCFQDKIILADVFRIEDLFNMRNDLNIVTPFKFANELVCLNVFLVDLEQFNYTMQAEVNVRQNATWIETGLEVNYVIRQGEDENAQTHNVKVNVKTPLKFLKFLRTDITLTVDENFYKSAVGIRAPNSSINVFGSLETEEAFVDTLLMVEVDTPLLKLPKSAITVKRDFTGKEKYIKVTGEIGKPISKSVSLQSDWYLAEDRVKASVGLKTWIESLKSVEAGVTYWNAVKINDTANITFSVKYLVDQTYKLSGNYSAGKVEGELYTPSSKDPHFEFQGDLSKTNDTQYNLQGELLNVMTAEVHKVSATFVTRNDSFHAMEVAMQPKTSTTPDELVLKVKKEEYGVNVELKSRALNCKMNANFLNPFNWDLRSQGEILKSGKKEEFELSTFINVQVNGNTTLYIHAQTPLEDIRNLTLTGNMLLSNNSGDISLRNRLNGDTHYATLQWKLIYMLDMFGRVLIGYQTEQHGTKDVDTRLFFKNPGRIFRNIEAGFDVDVDHQDWEFAANATIGFRNQENIDGVFIVRLPPPDNDDHRFLISYHANGGIQDTSYVIGYNTVHGKTNYASDGSVCNQLRLYSIMPFHGFAIIYLLASL